MICDAFLKEKDLDNETPLAQMKKTLQDSSEFIYAGFWRRFFALIADYLLLGSAGSIIIYVFGEIQEKSFQVVTNEFFLGLLVFVWSYFVFMESSEGGATLGKRLLGIRVTDLWGKRISDGKSFLRNSGRLVCTATLGIGYLMVGFTKNKQGLHDIMAGCLVIKKNQETKIQEPSIIKKFVDKLITKIQDLSINIKFLDKLMNFMGVKDEGWKRIIIVIFPIYFILYMWWWEEEKYITDDVWLFLLAVAIIIFVWVFGIKTITKIITWISEGFKKN